jgi:hypothetical protein
MQNRRREFCILQTNAWKEPFFRKIMSYSRLKDSFSLKCTISCDLFVSFSGNDNFVKISRLFRDTRGFLSFLFRGIFAKRNLAENPYGKPALYIGVIDAER